MTPIQLERNKQQARQAAMCDHDLCRPHSKARAEWWVGELSYTLGIVDAHGMIDVAGEVARDFAARYLAYRRAFERAPGWHPANVG